MLIAVPLAAMARRKPWGWNAILVVDYVLAVFFLAGLFSGDMHFVPFVALMVAAISLLLLPPVLSHFTGCQTPALLIWLRTTDKVIVKILASQIAISLLMLPWGFPYLIAVTLPYGLWGIATGAVLFFRSLAGRLLALSWHCLFIGYVVKLTWRPLRQRVVPESYQLAMLFFCVAAELYLTFTFLDRIRRRSIADGA